MDSKTNEEKFIDLKTDTRIKNQSRRELSFYFPIDLKIYEYNLTPNNPNNLKLTYEGIYSITRPEQGIQFINYFNKYKSILKDYTLIDGTAGLGGDLIYMAPFFKKCIAFEINPTHAKAILNNTTEYGINVEIINKDFTKEYEKYINKNTILWLDPPWGGPDKWKNADLKLYFYGEPSIYVNDFIHKCFKWGCIMLILKCPINTYIDDIKSRYKITTYYVTKIHNDTKSGYLFQLLIIEPKPDGGKIKQKSIRARSKSKSKTKKY